MIACRINSDRITPAYAGKRSQNLQATVRGKDHPRLRGEKFHKVVFVVAQIGSPPLTRGKDHVRRRDRKKPGITPAYAGKRAVCGGGCPVVEDHPRLRGEKFTGFFGFLCGGGSPPLTRGKDDIVNHQNRYQGITPAYAGKRFMLGGSFSPREDHPRLRGEKIAFG